MTKTNPNRYKGLSVAAVDDHEAVLQGVGRFLREKGVGRIDLFLDGTQLSKELAANDYDLYIIDLETKQQSGYDTIDMIRRHDSDAKIIVYTIHDEIWTVREVQSRNVNAVLYKDLSMETLMQAIEAILDGKTYFCERYQTIAKKSNTYEKPSKRELEVLKEIARGLSSKDIAKRMFISENTIETHRQSLFNKLQATNVADLMVKAIARGLIDVNEIGE